jgi:hypothetical protein
MKVVHGERVVRARYGSGRGEVSSLT